MRKGKLCFILLFLVLFYWPNLALSHSDLFPTDSIPSIPDLVLEQRGDKADVFFPDVTAISKRFPVVAVLQGAGVDKSFYTEFGTQLARYGFVVVIPNHFQMPFFPPGCLSSTGVATGRRSAMRRCLVLLSGRRSWWPGLFMAPTPRCSMCQLFLYK